MNKKSFFVYNIIGSILRASAMVILWVVFAQYYEIIIDYFGYILLVIMWWIFVYIYFYKKEALNEYIQNKNKEIEALSLKK